uniref:Ccr_01 putative toxin n=1 Tax=Crassispira cerithina TaxID=1077925 RepID=A0A098LXX0_CRACE
MSTLRIALLVVLIMLSMATADTDGGEKNYQRIKKAKQRRDCPTQMCSVPENCEGSACYDGCCGYS